MELLEASGHSLVSFRAMVQDTSISPEFYQDLDGNIVERTVLWAVSVPGESSWCSSYPGIHSLARPHKYPIPDTQHTGLQVKVRNYPKVLMVVVDPAADLRLSSSSGYPANRHPYFCRVSVHRLVKNLAVVVPLCFFF